MKGYQLTVFGNAEPAGSKDDATGRARAVRALEGLCRQHTTRVVVVQGDPVSKARPRFSSGRRGFQRHVYTPKKTIEGERRIAASLAGTEKFRSNVAVVAIFFRATRQRIDIDNMLKAILDGGTRAGIWDDDSQVTAIMGITEHDSVRPRTVIALGEHITTMARGDAALVSCRACGAKFKRREETIWCSRACREKLAVPIPCANCATPFVKRTTGKFCSSKCRDKARRREAN